MSITRSITLDMLLSERLAGGHGGYGRALFGPNHETVNRRAGLQAQLGAGDLGMQPGTHERALDVCARVVIATVRPEAVVRLQQAFGETSPWREACWRVRLRQAFGEIGVHELFDGEHEAAARA